MEGDYEVHPNEEKVSNYTRGGQSVWPLTAAVVIALTAHFGFKEEIKHVRGQLASYFTNEAQAASHTATPEKVKGKEGVQQLVYPAYSTR
ncbi:MAG: hypothetical protein PHX61_08475 [Alphaproteobacteria bacterium]|nr:hypothetical protein [Alphaproteobacteria bacterium]